MASTYHTLGTAALTVLLGVAWTLYVSGLADERGSLRAAAPEQGFLPLVQISLTVLGVLTITSEYATGTIRTSLTAVPKRGTLLLAKAGIVGLATFIAASTILLVTYSTSRLIADGHELGFNDISLAHDLTMLLASGLSPPARSKGPIPAASPSAPPAASTSPPPTGPSKASTIDTFVSSSEQTDTPTPRRRRRGLPPRAEARGFSPRYLMSVLTSEWLKIRSVRSTYLILGLSLGAVLLGLALAVMAAHMYDSAPAAKRPSARIADLEEVVVIVPQLCMGILGTLAITSEYLTGLIRTSLAIVPRRWPILAAKSTIVGTLGLLVGSMTVFGTYFVTRWVLGDRFSGAYTSAFLDRLPLLITLALTVPTFALLGLGLGALLRSTAAAIAILVGLVYVIPMIIGNIPEPWSDRLGSLMIGALPREITGDIITTSVYGYLLPPAAAVAVLVAYAALPLVVAGWCRRPWKTPGRRPVESRLMATRIPRGWPRVP
ncbi:hypothetical protein [Nonomuraea sp. NPDC049784]|uniref:hypothetical protein n=1 Tax=Nonomuraea sp. NPDC049784 TaxID=3154361 RepID=UPI0033EFBCEF